MLEWRGATVRYDGTIALHPTDLVAERGCITVLIGSSGSGKSTLMRLMIGLTRPSAGEVLFDGVPLVADNVRALRLRMGYVIQDGGLFPHLSARDNVTLMARFLGWPRARIEARLGELTQLTRLPEGAIDRYPAQLSGGQRQRVSLMRALMLDPEVLLLDEPMGALDPLIRSELQQDLKTAIAGLGKTCLLVTHDLHEAAYLGDRIVLLSDGAIVQRGTLAEMLAAPAEPFVTRFINAQRSVVV